MRERAETLLVQVIEVLVAVMGADGHQRKRGDGPAGPGIAGKVVWPARIAAMAMLPPSSTIALLPSTALTVPAGTGGNGAEIVFPESALFSKSCHKVVRDMSGNLPER